MNLKFNANSICAAERALGKSFTDMIAEIESKNGPALSTLRALLAAGVVTARYPKMPVAFLDVQAAGDLIDEHGVAAIGEHVGKALRGYFEDVAAGVDTANLDVNVFGGAAGGN